MFDNWKQRIFSNWDFMRFLRLALAVFILVEAWMHSDLLVGAVAGILLFQAVVNVGCCGVSGCEIKQPSLDKNNL